MSTTAKILAILLSCIALSVMSCSDDSGTNASNQPQTVSGTIGPTGGTLEIPGVITLDVPVGALSVETDFVITRNDSPPDPDGMLGPVSSDFTIEPAGTDFSVSAEITLAYDPADMGGGQEHEIMLYTHDGTSWTELTTQRDTAANAASAEIDHLSDFCAMVDTSLVLQGDVYAKLVVAKTMYFTDMGGTGFVYSTDRAIALFDSAYAPCVPVLPIHNVTVSCDGNALEWDGDLVQYVYPPVDNPYPISFLDPDAYYHFVVTPGSGVAALEDSILFPIQTPYITSPSNGASVPGSSALTVEWEEGGSGTVEIILITNDGDSAFFAETDNDGTYTISPVDMDQLSSGTYAMILNHYNKKNISATGYDPRGFIAARVMNTISIIVQ
ncbi:MAG: hypothetical protein JW763_00565 [candidate division Zixibacteria bacterium]|nr:hypothetical protein [candidate division Zixibacteria bacterium]